MMKKKNLYVKYTRLALFIWIISVASATFTSCSDDDEIQIEAAWDGRLPQPEAEDYAFGGGSGTESDPYRISSPLHLAQLASNVNGSVSNYSGMYFRQTADICLENHEWTPVGIGSGIFFGGQYDGGGFAISGLSITKWNGDNIGLFGYIRKAVLKNINLEGAIELAAEDDEYSSRTRSCCGSVCGMATEYSVIENCAYGGLINAENTRYIVGGICGMIDGDGSLTECENRANLKAQIAGGIVGYMSGYELAIAHCRNSGTVRGQIYAGGILGQCDVGCAWEDDMYCLTMTCCENTGEIHASMSAGGLGGIVACDDVCSIIKTPFVLVEGCCNTTSVFIDYRNQFPTLGGLFGYMAYTHLKGCYNTGTLITDGPANRVTVGGMVGLAVFCNAFTSCYRAGEIDEMMERGAMIGRLSDLEPYGAEYEDCWTSKYLCEGDERNLSLFGADAWPQKSEYWSSVGGWNGGNPVYPRLWWQDEP